MPFRLMVMCTSANDDLVDAPGDCGSVSYCGAVDRYPDARDMGYPFHRPFGSTRRPCRTRSSPYRTRRHGPSRSTTPEDARLEVELPIAPERLLAPDPACSRELALELERVDECSARHLCAAGFDAVLARERRHERDEAVGGPRSRLRCANAFHSDFGVALRLPWWPTL